MNKLKYLFIVAFISFSNVFLAQEIKASVKVTSELPSIDKNILSDLQSTIEELLQNTAWTDIEYKDEEKVNISLAVKVIEIENNRSFKANIIFTVSRQVFDSNYYSPLIQFQDQDVRFEFDKSIKHSFKQNFFTSDLVSIISFYAMLGIGLDQISLAEYDNNNAFILAKEIANIAESNGVQGFSIKQGSKNRIMLIEDLLSPNFKNFYKAFYSYHRRGLDMMTRNLTNAKKQIEDALIALEPIARRNNSLLLFCIIEAKAEEIEGIFSAGEQINKPEELKNTLKIISPNQRGRWNRLK